jgi:hypothetical protein
VHPIFHAFTSAMFQFACITAALYLTGLVIGWIARSINSIYSSFMFPKLGLYVFGIVGIPAHEFSHYIFCKIFRLEVTKIKWFDVKGKGGAHGAVTHNYDPSNPVHRFAHLFVGFAPILLLPILVAGLFWLLFPGAEAVFHHAKHFEFARISFQSFLKLRTLAFVYLSFSLVAHMDLSKEDFKIATSGIPILFFILLLGNLIAVLVGFDANRLLEKFALNAWALWSPVFGLCLTVALLHFICAWTAASAIHFLFRQPPIRVLP